MSHATRVAAALEAPPPHAPPGLWSRRLAEARVPTLATAAERLTLLCAELAAERDATATAIGHGMRDAHASAPAAAARARALATEAATVHTQLTESAPLTASPLLEAVHTLAQAKDRMCAARDVLLAAEAWSAAEADIRTALAAHDLRRAADRLASSQRSLVAFDQYSAYAASRRGVLDELLTHFDAAVLAHIRAAVDADDPPAVGAHAALLTRLDRTSVFAACYLDCRAAPLAAAWAAAPDVARMLTALTALITDEAQRYAPHLAFASPAPLAQRALELLEPPLAHVVTATDDPDVLVTMYDRAAAAADAIAAVATPAPWLTTLAAAFADRQHAFVSLEAAAFARRWDAAAAPLATRLDRICVLTSSGAWATCVAELAELLGAMRSTALDLLAAAAMRTARFTAGTRSAALTARHAALLEPVHARAHAAIESIRTRFVRAVHDLSDDADAVTDWDAVREALRVVKATHALADAADARVGAGAAGGAAGALDDACRAAARPPSPLPAPPATPPAALHAAQLLVLDVLLSRFRTQLDAYRAHGALPAAADSLALDKSVRVVFSRSPCEDMSRLGEGLLNMPRLLEAFVAKDFAVFSRGAALLPFQDDASECARAHHALSATLLASGAPAPTATPPEHVLAAWLRALAMTLVAELRTSVLPAIMRRAHDRAQLATDMDYLCTIAAALNAASPELRETADALAR